MLLLTHTFSNASEAINALFMSLISLLWLPCIKKQLTKTEGSFNYLNVGLKLSTGNIDGFLNI